MSEQRRLAAVMAADVVGYSRLMGRGHTGDNAAACSIVYLSSQISS